MQTHLSSSKKEVVIGEGCPTVIIGERINPTGKQYLAKALEEENFQVLEEEARIQVEAGADLLDVNVGGAGIDETKVLPMVVQYLTRIVDVPLVIDSANPAAIEAALKVYHGKALINSVTAEEASLNRVLPLVSNRGCAVIGLCMDEKGIPDSATARLNLAQKILRRAESCGLKHEDLLIDPIVMSVGTDYLAAVKTLETIRLVEKELGLNTCLGTSNISFGLPDRRSIGFSFLCLSVAAGARALIVDPTALRLKRLLRATEMLLGRDEWAQRYLVDYRSELPDIEKG